MPLAVLFLFTTVFLATDARAEWRLLRRLQVHLQGCRRHLVGKSKILLSFLQVAMLAKTIYPFAWRGLEACDDGDAAST